MSNFAKLYETDRGQVLVMLQSNSENGTPEVRIFAQPPSMNVCSVAFGFKDNDEGWIKAEHGFEMMDEEMASRAVDDLYKFSAEL